MGFRFVYDIEDNCIHANLMGYTPEDFIVESQFNERIMREGRTNMGLFRDLFEDYYNLNEKSVHIKSVHILRSKEEIIYPSKKMASNP